MPIPLPLPLPNPCLEFPFPAPPQLPSPLTLGIPIPAINLDLTLCCKLPPIPDFLPDIPLPPNTLTLDPTIIVIINNAIVELFAFFDAQQFECPLE